MSFISNNADKKLLDNLKKVAGGGKAWKSGTDYATGSVVSDLNNIYIAISNHISEVGNVSKGRPNEPNSSVWIRPDNRRKVLSTAAPTTPTVPETLTMDMKYDINFLIMASCEDVMTLANPINTTVGNEGTIIVRQDSIPGTPVSWGSHFKFSDGSGGINTDPLFPALIPIFNSYQVFRYHVMDSDVILMDVEFAADMTLLTP